MDEIQKEVWDTVFTYTKLIQQGKVDEFLEYFHEEYTGWNNIAPLPSDKQTIVDELSSSNPRKIIEDCKIIPIKITVQDELAIVHYYLSGSSKTDDACGIKHYTDVLVKKKNKWLLIADHFGVQNKRKKLQHD